MFFFVFTTKQKLLSFADVTSVTCCFMPVFKHSLRSANATMACSALAVIRAACNSVVSQSLGLRGEAWPWEGTGSHPWQTGKKYSTITNWVRHPTSPPRRNRKRGRRSSPSIDITGRHKEIPPGATRRSSDYGRTRVIKAGVYHSRKAPLEQRCPWNCRESADCEIMFETFDSFLSLLLSGFVDFWYVVGVFVYSLAF